MRNTKTFRMVIYAVLGAMAAALMFISIPYPVFSFLSIDFSELPVLFAALLFSPIAGIAVAGIKILLYTLFATGAGDPIGMVSNFMASILFVLPVAYVYRHFQTIKGLIAGLGIATVFMAVTMALLNYLIFLPAYSWLIGWELSGQALWYTTLVGILPFNIVKGVFISLLFVPLFLKLYPLLQPGSLGTDFQRRSANHLKMKQN
ncbi:riboflavin transporter FmnP [Geomicrobium halophilum]|uniref:Riboflavin transporter n=1 Tax=Geomicrobium halophilum TaxID=549000 RepID=A0A841PYW0_9BACL|nr:ECF transporter S component [Geomicrobium halophilum]MBB6449465.1 riboflavin transporter FmnP [Geomicrobium halophilum]